jgi:hypothetical protein
MMNLYIAGAIIVSDILLAVSQLVISDWLKSRKRRR